MMKKNIALATLASLLMTSCTYYSKTNETKFTPLGAAPHELIDTVVHDVKECAQDSDNTCATKTGHDGYDASKIKSMSNEELVAYVKKQNERMDKQQKKK